MFPFYFLFFFHNVLLKQLWCQQGKRQVRHWGFGSGFWIQVKLLTWVPQLWIFSSHQQLYLMQRCENWHNIIYTYGVLPCIYIFALCCHISKCEILHFYFSLYWPLKKIRCSHVVVSHYCGNNKAQFVPYANTLDTFCHICKHFSKAFLSNHINTY